MVADSVEVSSRSTEMVTSGGKLKFSFRGSTHQPLESTELFEEVKRNVYNRTDAVIIDNATVQLADRRFLLRNSAIKA